MENLTSVFPDWAHLPLAAVYLISEKVNCITDYVRFRAVCSPWRSASLPKPRHLPHQLPWLMIPSLKDLREDGGVHLFYDLWQSKMRKIHLPETIGKKCCASYRGWLLLMAPQGTELFLLNPLTRARVQLPSFTAPVNFIWDKAHNDLHIPTGKVDFLFNSELRNYVITKMTFSVDLTDPNCLIMMFIQSLRAIFFCKLGDRCWTLVVLPRVPSGGVTDAAYNNGSFYLLYKRFILNFDLSQHKLQVQDMYSFKPELQSVLSFFLEGKSGIYIVAVNFTIENEEAEKITERFPKQKLELYQVQDQEQRMEVKRIVDISDTTIFNGDNYQYLAVRTDDWDSLNGGCMYNVRASSADNAGDESSYSIYFAKVDKVNPEPVVLDLAKNLPIWPSVPAMWFQPSFV
ncbi:F-box protein [Carex littledalei]|uniref:F-box protein n=1 Tax=Carex littledalei TaxID=544730 RepID=A0A833R169_9POAL|nr:F-box protein [Carex littledalei]